LAHAETATLQHDNSGNVTQRTTPLGSTTYQYDALDRLTNESGPAKMQSFNYDANGNRLKDGIGSVNNYTIDPNSNRTLTTPVGTVTHDAAGNLTADGLGRTFFFNQAGQLYQVKLNGILIATYTYDYRGLRLSKVTTASAPQGAQTIVYLYDQWNRIMEEYSVVSGNATLIRSYLWRNDTPVAQIDRVSGVDKFLYYETDQLNTPRAATDSTGKIVWRWESDAFGTTLPNEDVSNSGSKTRINLRFGGMMYYDQESRLFYAMTRYYSPQLGEFIQPDHLDLVRQAVNPIYAQYSQPLDLKQALNQPFTYVGNNPLGYTDPLGLFEMYGSWGGANWSGGKSGPIIPGNPAPPKDAIDACAMQHDYCYAAAQNSKLQCTASTPPPISDCDTQLSQCLTKVNYNSIDSLWGKIFGPYATWWAALHGRISR
jgi:RHS repeat-associated protein